ncbi:hypothetical protein GE09DRAFT_947729 [Coniochaeta sp. 2T2.1]|nr:hypothetical protein GE09DRAFT_947729 [Coniochaeta sp. 2T2.1]
MANGDGDQSKRPALNQHDSDSQVSDRGGQQHVHHRSKTAKHHVAGGRIHARVASSKNLHKGGTSSAKLNRRQASPGSPDAALFAFPPTAAAPLSHGGGHRRATSDLNLSREASATNLLLKKNSSQTSLKRNRSKVEIIGKKSKSSTNLKSHTIAGLHNNTANTNHSKTVNQVHFNLGDDDDEDNPEDEWVDASTSASPLLSRRASVVSGGQQSAASSAGNSRPATSSSLQQEHPQPSPSPPRPQSSRSTNGTDSFRNVSTSRHSQYLTSRILERTPAQAAQPTMSNETASVRLTSSRAQSPDDPESPPSPVGRIRPGSSGNKAELTSRFITKNSADLDSGPGDSFTGALARAANGRIEVSTSSPANVQRPKSTGNLAARNDEESAAGTRTPLSRLRTQHDDEDAAAFSADAKRSAAAYAMNRTQQKINLQRASSSLEPSIPPHHPALAMSGMASSASVQGYRGETVLPRLLERTGMEYLVVRRYQNPIARSLARISQLPGQDRKLRIHKTRSATPGHSRQGSELRSGPVQDLRDREGRGDGPGALIAGRGERRPASRRGVTGDGTQGDDGNTTGLSGSSLVDGGEDATTLAVLRNLWDKNMDLSASQD